jgi:O-antigen ligase
MIIFLVLVNIGIEERHIYRFVSLFFIFMVDSDIVGVLQVTPSSPAWKLAAAPPGTADAGFVRVNGLFEWPLALANYTAIAMPLGLLPLFFEEIRGHKRALLLCAALIMVAAVLLAGSRESWGALLVATLFLGLTVERRLLRVLVQGILPGLLVGALVFQPFLRRLEQVGNGGGRLDFLAASLPVIRSHPWLGVGPGRFGGHVALITHSPLYAQYDLTEVFSRQMTQQIDMFWTHLLAESGVLGTAAYVAAIAACFLAGRRAYREAVTPRQKALLLGLLYAIPVSVVVSFVASFLEATNSATVFWSLMGMLSVMAACPEREPQVQGREHD